MLVKKRVILERHINSLGETQEAIEEDIRNSFHTKQYSGIGVIQSSTINAVGLFIPSSRKRAISTVPVDVTFDILSIPPGAIIPNATLFKVTQKNDNITYVFTCMLCDIDGKPMPTSTIMLNGVAKEGIVGAVTTAGKNAESLSNYKKLVKGSVVNLVCLSCLPVEGKTQTLVFNADVILTVKPKYFKYTKAIDIDPIRKLMIASKFNNPLFAEHQLGDTKDLVEGTIYAMSIYGFTPKNSDESIDFLVKPVTTCTSPTECEIGLDSLSTYLYYTMYNWRCVLETLKNTQNGTSSSH